MKFSRVWRVYPGLFVGVVLVVVCVGVWGILWIRTPQRFVTFAVLNIGQGDGLYIEGPTGIEVLVDAGPGDGSILRALPEVMAPFDRFIDAIIATHPDADHSGGFIQVLERYRVGAFIEPGIRGATQTYKTLEQSVSAQHIPRYIARRGMTLDLGGGAVLHVLYPDKDVTNFVKKTNDGCIVAKLTYGETSAMLTCDMPISVETHLVAISSSTELASTLLKVGHHGSKYSTSEAFLASVHPTEALISVGANNRYGHPAPRVLGLLVSQKVPYLRTDQAGTIIYRSNGHTFWRVQ